jgi:4-diphosphocytidyl-2-C-methyl-D-erythritol kinase
LTRTRRAPAKLNLYLEILGRRSDGFHELETLMVPISLADSLAFTPIVPTANGDAAPIQLHIQHCLPVRPPSALEAVPSGSTNLVVKALELFRDRSGCRFGAQLELFKRIPAAAGLGGASSDAAAALLLANHGWQLHWPQSRLFTLAAEIGSDVPFFLNRHPAICRGRGEQLETLHNLSALHFVVVKPPAALTTADVYAAHDRLTRNAPPAESGRAVRIDAALAAQCSRQPRGWCYNRLQAAAETLTPWVERLRTLFDRLDCLAHQLTGSGSAYFGVCRHAQHARRLAALLRTRQVGLVYATRSYR